MQSSNFVISRLSQVLTMGLVSVILICSVVYWDSHWVPKTAQPSDSNFVENPAAYAELLDHLAGQAGKPCDVIFIGASNVARFMTEGRTVWDHYYGPRHAFDFAVSGDRTENVLWRFDHMDLRGLNPKVAVIFAGLNNLASTPNARVFGIAAVVDKTTEVFPGIKVMVVSLTPSRREDNAKVVAANKILRQYATDHGLYYVDIYSYMPRVGNNWRGLGPDRLHLTAHGYEMWAEQMEPEMQKVLSPLPGESAPVVSGLAATR